MENALTLVEDSHASTGFLHAASVFFPVKRYKMLVVIENQLSMPSSLWPCLLSMHIHKELILTAFSLNYCYYICITKNSTLFSKQTYR